MPDLRMKTIKVFDGLPGALLKEELFELATRPIWQYGWRSNIKVDKYFFWHAHFAGGGLTNRVSCLDELNSRTDLSSISRLWYLLVDTILSGHEPLRVYANAHTYGAEGYCHTDNLDDENYFSTIFYAHSEWEKKWGGELLFYDAEGDIIRAVPAKPGRVVSFPGSIIHKVASPSRTCANLRVSYVFKTQLIQGVEK